MRVIADRAARAKRWERLTADSNANDELFFKAFDRAADRGYGRPGQAIEHTGPHGTDLPGVTQVWVIGDQRIEF